jgi:hypothetical protein
MFVMWQNLINKFMKTFSPLSMNNQSQHMTSMHAMVVSNTWISLLILMIHLLLLLFNKCMSIFKMTLMLLIANTQMMFMLFFQQNK